MGNKIIKFRIYPETKYGLYFNVRIYSTITAMRKAASNYYGLKGDFEDAAAACKAVQAVRTDKNGRKYLIKELGTIFFHTGQLGGEIVTHEVTHATLRWMERVGFDALDRKSDPDYVEGTCSQLEERFCYTLGRMANQIFNACWIYGLYK